MAEAVSSPPDQRVIANKALLLLGSALRVSNLSERDGPEAENLLTLWDIARRSALVLHPWNFAIKRQRIERDAEAPTGAGHAFKLPADCLRWLPWSRGFEWFFDAVEEGGLLLTDHAGPIIVRYIRDVPEAAGWSPLFVDAMAYTLGLEYCQSKTQLLGVRDRLKGDRDDVIAQAKRVDGMASPNRGQSPSVVTSRWAGARFRQGARPWRS